jgi:hypothetical protein
VYDVCVYVKQPGLPLSVNHLGCVPVGGLLDFPNLHVARSSIAAAMTASSVDTIRHWSSSDAQWTALMLHYSGHFFLPTPGGIWPMPDGSDRRFAVENREHCITAVFGDNAQGLSRTQPVGIVRHDRHGSQRFGHESDPSMKRARGREHSPEERGGPRQRVEGDASAVLFCSEDGEALTGMEEALLTRHGLVQAVVYPGSAEDIRKHIERMRPRVVILSSRHSGVWKYVRFMASFIRGCENSWADVLCPCRRHVYFSVSWCDLLSLRRRPCSCVGIDWSCAPP